MKKTIFTLAAIVLTTTASFAQAKDSKNCDLRTYFGTHTATSEIAKADLGNVSELIAKDECDAKKTATVESFEFTAMVGGKPVVYTGKGNAISADMKKTLGEVKSGSKIFIDNVKAKMSDGSVKGIPGITLKVK
ncbi:MAG: GldM family protein [Bacteroidia bacterium]